jgi:succinoglycan biosynthesis protein ExoL
MIFNTNKMPRVLVLLPVVGQPRHSKRIDMLISSGLDIKVLAFERDYPLGRKPSVPVTIIGYIEHGQYFHRIGSLIKALKPIRKYARNCDIIYCFGHDLAAVALISTMGWKVQIVLEVGDIQDHQMKGGIIGRIARIVDRILMQRIDLLVLISEGFIEFYKKRLGYLKESIIIENKIENNSLPANNNSIRSQELRPYERPLRIGYFGLLRDEWGWSVLRQLASRFPGKYEIILAGRNFNLSDFDEVLGNSRNIHYIGEYSSPSGLADIYSRVDMVWICYDPIKEYDINLLAGRPNRFYESCYFLKPIFARQSVAFSKDVDKYDIGYCISSITKEEAIAEILGITAEDFLKWQDRMINLPRTVFMETDEGNLLFTKLSNLIK